MSDLPAFPPNDIRGFLAFCAGEWLALRSTFLPGELEPPSGEGEGDGDEWHSSERGELRIAYQEPSGAAESGSLLITPPGGATRRRVTFSTDGRFDGGDGERGQWQLWPDGSLDLMLEREGVEVRERIWFTKPNLRLRSTIERGSDGRPARASFSTEIRRVSRAAAAVA
ncbi:phycobiliprotein lyase [Cyanobium sp. FGCU-6]|nr:phycobiliprotein lyase [Cyanobium sp. FGCU6]